MEGNGECKFGIEWKGMVSEDIYTFHAVEVSPENIHLFMQLLASFFLLVFVASIS